MKERVAILTNFMEFVPGYSLTGIVLDQATMLSRHGHEVHLFVNDKYHGTEEWAPGVVVHKRIPFGHLKDFISELEMVQAPELQQMSQRTQEVLIEDFKKLQIDIAFTHDFIFQGWYLPYGIAVRNASQHLPKTRWLHWVHSVPTSNKDWWNISAYGKNHKIAYPNATDRVLVAEQFQSTVANVRCIPHIKDIRSWFDFSEETCAFIDKYPQVLQADVVKLYPASVDRLRAKRVDIVLQIMAEIKKTGKSVCLVIANQWATARQHKESIAEYQRLASGYGLDPGIDFIFTSDFGEKYEVGIPKRMVRELFQCSNLFIFPTREETYGLVLPEAALAGGVLCVLNRSLRNQTEIAGGDGNALYFDFGSYHHRHSVENPAKYYKDIAWITIGRIGRSESIRLKTHFRQHNNMDYLYNNNYLPIFGESKLWIDK